MAILTRTIHPQLAPHQPLQKEKWLSHRRKTADFCTTIEGESRAKTGYLLSLSSLNHGNDDSKGGLQIFIERGERQLTTYCQIELGGVVRSEAVAGSEFRDARQFGNGWLRIFSRSITRGYNTSLQLTSLAVSEPFPFPSTNLEYRSSATQNNGRITQMKNWVIGEEVSYQYDSLKRLISASTTGPEWGLSFGYDGFGTDFRQRQDGSQAGFFYRGSGKLASYGIDDSGGLLTVTLASVEKWFGGAGSWLRGTGGGSNAQAATNLAEVAMSRSARAACDPTTHYRAGLCGSAVLFEWDRKVFGGQIPEVVVPTSAP